MSPTSPRPWASRETNQNGEEERVGEKVGGNRASYAPFHSQETVHASDVTKPLSASKVSSKIVGSLCPTPTIISQAISFLSSCRKHDMAFYA